MMFTQHANRAVGIVGTGRYMPAQIVTRDDFIRQGASPQMLDAWGVVEHRLRESENAIDMEVAAGLEAIANAGLTPLQIDLIIGSALRPVQANPPNVSCVQHRIGAHHAVVFELNQSCSSPIPALVVAANFVSQRQFSNVLLIGSSDTRDIVDPTDPAVYAVLGDGAAAVVVSVVKDGFGVLDFDMASDGQYWGCVGIQTRLPKYPGAMVADTLCKPYFFIESRTKELDTFREYTRRSVPESVFRLLNKAKLSVADITFFISHQNVNTVHGVWFERLGVLPSKVITTHEKYGNLGPANLWNNLHEAVSRCALRDGDMIIMMAQGSGFSVGSVLLRWG